MDKLLAMRTFVEIVDRGSLTAAAESLGKSPPAVVRSLSELEKSIDAVLLRRTTRRMALTDEGQVYLERCRRILADVDEAEELVGQGRVAPTGLLRVTAPILFGQMHVAPLTVAFVERYPAVRVELLLLDRIVNLVEEGIDVALRIGRLAESTMRARSIGTMRRVVCASPALLDRVGVPAHPEALASLPCVGFRGGAGAPWTFRDCDRELQVAVDGRLTINNAAAARDACRAGLGFGWFFAYQIAPAVAAGELRVVLEEFERPAVPVSLVYADARFMSARLRSYLDWMVERLRWDGDHRDAGERLPV